MRLRAIVLPLVLLSIAWGAPSDPDIIGDGGSIDGSAGQDSQSSPSHSGGGGGGSSAPAPTFLVVPSVQYDPATGERCLQVTQRPGDPNSDEAIDNEIAVMRLSGQMALCPGSAAPVPSPAAVAAQLWRDRMTLPRSEPHIAPGRAISGKDAFLEVHAPTHASRTFEVFGAALTIEASATTWDVDWGDGEWSRGLRSQGGPWPDGDIRHAYARAGAYDVVVHEHWTGTWSMATQHGAVRGTLSTEGRIEDFPVQEVQAVRNR